MKLAHCLFAAAIASIPAQGLAREYRFNPAMVDSGGEPMDLSLFQHGGQPPGIYPVDIFLNGEWVDAQQIAFSAGGEQGVTLVPCLNRALLRSYGVKIEHPEADSPCFDFAEIAGARVEFDFNQQQLLLSIPQLFLQPKLTGIAPQSQWNDGITALLMNYQANTSETRWRDHSGQRSRTSWLQLAPGINIGAWRLRNITSLQQSGDRAEKWQSLNTYAERGLYDLKSRFSLGERYTPSDVFDSVPFRGVMLGSDDSMVPGSQSSYAPVIRGIARTQARVEVRQNGFTVYSSVVAPGPFALTDLVTGGGNGDLHVTVLETDGLPQVFTVPYQMPAVAVKEGYLRYSTMAGEYRPADHAVTRAPVMQLTAMYGLPGDITVYGGVQGAEHYRSAQSGLGLSLGNWGALSVDMTVSDGQQQHRAPERGHAGRIRYSKQFVQTDTSFAMASYQQASGDFNTLSDVLDTWREDGTGDTAHTRPQRRSRTEVSVSQGLGEWGYFTLSGYRERYRSRQSAGDALNVSYTVPLGSMTISLSGTRTPDTGNTVGVWLSVPLARWSGGDVSASWRYTRPSQGHDAHAMGVNGSLADRQLSWSLNQQYRPGQQNDRNNGALSMQWRGRYGQVSGNYSYSQRVYQRGAAIEGGVLVHGAGVTFSQTLGDTVALIEAPGAGGVQVGAWPGVKTDFRGYTTLPSLQPYQENTVTLNPLELPDDVDISKTDIRVVPTGGAVIPVRFATRQGGRALVTLRQADGTPVPYGAVASLTEAGGYTGIVGQNGQVYLTGLPDEGELTVRWAQKACQARYQLPAGKDSASLYHMQNTCHEEEGSHHE